MTIEHPEGGLIMTRQEAIDEAVRRNIKNDDPDYWRYVTSPAGQSMFPFYIIKRIQGEFRRIMSQQ